RDLRLIRGDCTPNPNARDEKADRTVRRSRPACLYPGIAINALPMLLELVARHEPVGSCRKSTEMSSGHAGTRPPSRGAGLHPTCEINQTSGVRGGDPLLCTGPPR